MVDDASIGQRRNEHTHTHTLARRRRYTHEGKGRKGTYPSSVHETQKDNRMSAQVRVYGQCRRNTETFPVSAGRVGSLSQAREIAVGKHFVLPVSVTVPFT